MHDQDVCAHILVVVLRHPFCFSRFVGRGMFPEQTTRRVIKMENLLVTVIAEYEFISAGLDGMGSGGLAE